MKIAYVEWEDASGVRGTMSLAAALKEGPSLMRTGGMLIREDTEVVVVAQDRYEWTDAEGEMHETARELEVIPRGMVRRLEIMEVSPDAVCIAGPTGWEKKDE